MAAPDPAVVERKMYVDMHLGGVDDPAYSLADLRDLGGGGVNAWKAAKVGDLSKEISNEISMSGSQANTAVGNAVATQISTPGTVANTTLVNVTSSTVNSIAGPIVTPIANTAVAAAIASDPIAANAAAAAVATAMNNYLGNGNVTIPIPGYAIPVTVTQTLGTYSASINHEGMHVKKAGVTMYVDPVNGNNNNTGLSWAAAKKDPGNASFHAGAYDVNEVIIRGGVYTRAQSTIPVGAAATSRSDIVYRAEAGTRPVLTQCDTGTWTVQAGTTYKATLSGPNMVIDLTAPKSDAGLPIPLTKVASIAEVTATPGTCANVGGIQYVRLFNDRVPDTNVLVSRNTYNINTATSDPLVPFSMLFDGIEFWGGLYARVKGWRAGDQIIAKNCAWRFADENGIGLQGVNGVFITCEATHNGIDGFNYHDVTGLTCQVLEVGCVGRLNGKTVGGSSQNGSTSHDNSKIVRVGGVYEFNPGPNVADVNNAYSANFGVRAGNALGYGSTPDYDYTTPEMAGKVWLVGCTSTSSKALRATVNNAWVRDFRFLGTNDLPLQPYT